MRGPLASATVLVSDRLGIERPRDTALWMLLAWASLNAVVFPFLRVGDPATLTFDRVWVPLLGLVVLFTLRRERTLRVGPARALMILAAVFVVSYGLRALLTPEDRLTVLKVWVDAIVIPTILLFAAWQLVLTMREWRMLLVSLTVAGALLALTGVLQYVFDFELATRSGGTPLYDAAIDRVRVSGPFANSEAYAVALLACYSATLCWLRLGAPRAVAITIIGLELVAIGVSFFRAAWIGALLVTAVALLWRTGARRHPRLVVAALVALVVIGFGLTRFDAVSTRLSNSQNVTGRVATWAQDLKVFADAPVVGVGVERFHASTDEESNVVVSGVEALDYPHSSYLGLLAEQGIVGFVPFLLLSIAVWWLIRRFRAQSDSEADLAIWACLAGAALAYLVMSLTLSILPLGVTNGHLTLLLGGAAGLLAGRASADSSSDRTA